jgi:phenylalanyl-tRNA synthetase beta chain
MKISYNWLQSITDISQTPDEISSLLTGCGLEVEGLDIFENIKGSLNGIVVGKVLTCEQHPNADRLKITTVDIGLSNPLHIVCGAPNVSVGQKVLVAPIGTIVHPLTGDAFEIKKSKIRGELSEGMICAEDELSLGKSHDGILILPHDVEVGKPATAYFDVTTDTVFEIGLTANRGDAASHLGVARDLRALTGCKINMPARDFVIKTPQNKMAIGVTIADTKGCGRYSGISISGVEVKPSPQWMQFRLKAIGLNPVNNIVDITNYILHEMGQPLHAFDLDKISGKQIVVKNADANQLFITLDGVERKLLGSECMICDSEKPLAIAGVYGGLQAGITESTKNIFIESAYFYPASVRKTAKLHGLNTDSSFRYERGTDPNATVDALKRAVQLILQFGGGEIASDIIDIYPTPISNFEIEFRLSNCHATIGQQIPENEIARILELLNIVIAQRSSDVWKLNVPAYKSDVTREADVIEEILRIYGLDKISIPDQLKSSLARSEDEDAWLLKDKTARFLTSIGFVEMLSNSLSSLAYYNEQQLSRAVKPLNPLSNDLSVMRMSMLYNGLEMIQYNSNRKLKDIRAYEFGYVYQIQNEVYNEQPILAMFLAGNKTAEHWQQSAEGTSLFQLKSFVQQALAQLGIKNISFNHTHTHPEMDLAIEVNSVGISLGSLGRVETSITSKFNIDAEIFYATLDWQKILASRNHAQFKLKDVSSFPAVRRDLALLVNKSVPYAQLEQISYAINKQLVREVNIFDVYEGENIPQGKKSYAISLLLQSDDRTLTDNETEELMNLLAVKLNKETGAEVRGA